MSLLLNGCLMLLMNIGGRYLQIELPKSLEYLFKKYMILRWLIIFAISYVATKNVKISILLTLIFILVFKYLLNTDKKSCLIKIDNKI